MPVSTMAAINAVITVAGVLFSLKSSNDADEAARATKLGVARENFTKEISGEFQVLSDNAISITQIDTTLKVLESRITSILSDYTSLLNQISIVSTLMLGVASGLFGAMLGNTEDQPNWKVNMYTISCILTICLSIISVIESFFLSIHIYAEESKFTAGMYPHRYTNGRNFNLEAMRGLSASYSTSIITFFVSFLFFASTLLSVVYVGLGKSYYILGNDDRLYTTNSERFPGSGTNTISEIETGYQGVAFFLTMVVIIIYLVIITLFITKYRKYILWPKSLLKCCGMNKESLKQPMRITSFDFERVQSILQHEFQDWSDKHKEFVNKWADIYQEENWKDLNRDNPVLVTRSDTRNYDDVEYEMYVWKSFDQQLMTKRKALVQMRLLQVTDSASRRQYYEENPGDQHEGELLMVHANQYYKAISQKIKF